jgi:ubiquinone/menaquinone biosynthesis C-methylase UbiE
MSDNERLASEEKRIRMAYAKRQCGDLYSLFNPGHLFLMQTRERQVLDLLRANGRSRLGETRILEIGCGSGYWIRDFIKWGASPEYITGIDILPDRISLGRKLSPELVTYRCASVAKLDFPDHSFDLVLQSTVFTSILDADLKRKIAAEMIRVLKPEGLIIWYDFLFNNPRNRDVLGIKKQEIYSLFPDCEIKLKKITLFPHLTRALAPYSFLLCSLLDKISILCTHYLGIIKKAQKPS